MEVKLASIWDEAKAFHSARLTGRNRVHVAGVKSPEELAKKANELKIKYQKQKLVVLLEKINPFLAQLRSFSRILNTLVQSHPEIAALIWGSVSLILEASLSDQDDSEASELTETQLAARHETTLERMGDSFETFERCLPRFYFYIKEYSKGEFSERLKTALVRYYAEVIGHYEDAILFLQKHPFKNILLCSRPARVFDRRSASRIEKLKCLTSWVDQEACLVREVVKEQTQKKHHDQILQIMIPLRMKANNLPYKNIPYLRNQAFHGRAKLLTNLLSSLGEQNRNAGLSQVALYGLGGVGKTQIALEYTYRHFQDYRAIFWVNAETSLKLAESFSTQAIALGLANGSSLEHHNQLREVFKKWLLDCNERDTADGPISWLLVFDDVEDVALLEHYWPKGALGSIILTTRNPEVARVYAPCHLEVPLFTRKESEDLLLSLNSVDHNDPVERKAITEIADRMDDLPLGLTVVAGYASSIASSYRNILKCYPNIDRDFLFRGPGNRSRSPHAYMKSMDTTWTLTLQRTDLNTRLPMETLAFLGKDDLPLEFFAAVPAECKLYNGPNMHFPTLTECLHNPLEDQQILDQAIANLLKRSLVSRSQSHNSLVCQRIVKEAVLNSMEGPHRRQTFMRTIFILNAKFPSLQYGLPLLEQWEVCEKYRSHVSSLLEAYKGYRESLGFPILLCEIIRRCAWYLYEHGSFDDASEMLDATCEILESAAASGDHPGYHRIYIDRLTADIYHIRGSIEYERNQPGHGMPWLTKSKQLRQRVIEDDLSNKNDVYELTVTNANIALTMMAEKQAREALPWIEELLNFPAEYVSKDIWTANLANLYWLLGDYEQSLAVSERSFELTRKAHGLDSLRMATIHFNTGNAYLSLGKTDNAFHAFSDCLRICHSRMPHHYKTGFTCHKLGVIMRGRGDLDSSATMLREALNVLKMSSVHLGAQLRTAFVLSEVLEANGVFQEAGELRGDIMDQLRNKMSEDLDGVEVDEAYFDRFVLFCHR